MRPLILFVLVFVMLPVPLHAQRPPCPHPRLRVGYTAVVVEEGIYNNVRIRPALGATVVAQLAPGAEVPVVGGPVCQDSFNWYEVEVNGVFGWTADGDQDEPWLESTGQLNPAQPTSAPSAFSENALPVPPLLPPATSAPLPTAAPPLESDRAPLAALRDFIARSFAR